MPKDGLVQIPQDVREDMEFFKLLMPYFNGITNLDRSMVPFNDQLEIDSCLTGCGALCGTEFDSCKYPTRVLEAKHTITHLEMLNAVVALRLWSHVLQGQRFKIFCDNSNTCLALQKGRSKEIFMQACIRTIFLITVENDIEILVCHRPGVSLIAADALSRIHTSDKFREVLRESGLLEGKTRVMVPDAYFDTHD